MTSEQAESALSIDPAAIVFAGRDFDSLAAQFASDPAPSPYDPPTGRPDPKAVIADVRQAAAQATTLPGRLVIIKDGTDKLAGILAQRDKDRASAQARLIERNRLIAEQERIRGAAQARRERANRAFFPTFQAMRARLQAAETALGEASKASDMAAAHDALAADLAGAIDTMRTVGATILPAAA